MNLSEKIIEYGINHHKASDREQFNDKFIEEIANDYVDTPVDEKKIGEISEVILEKPEAYHLYKLPPKRQLELKRKMPKRKFYG